VAVDPTHVPLDDPALQGLVRANVRALQTIAEQPDVAVRHLRSFLGRVTHDEAVRHYDRYVAPWFTTDGQVDPAIAEAAVAAVAAELGVAGTAVADVYRTSLVAAPAAGAGPR
jgi:hypothetical protein